MYPQGSRGGTSTPCTGTILPMLKCGTSAPCFGPAARELLCRHDACAHQCAGTLCCVLSVISALQMIEFPFFWKYCSRPSALQAALVAALPHPNVQRMSIMPISACSGALVHIQLWSQLVHLPMSGKVLTPAAPTPTTDVWLSCITAEACVQYTELGERQMHNIKLKTGALDNRTLHETMRTTEQPLDRGSKASSQPARSGFICHSMPLSSSSWIGG